MEAHDLSIEKWHDIVFNGGVDGGVGDCALCDKYYNPFTKGYHICDGCPVLRHSGRNGCMGTPYVDWHSHQTRKHPAEFKRVHTGCKECQRLAIVEYQFLKSLKVGWFIKAGGHIKAGEYIEERGRS